MSFIISRRPCKRTQKCAWSTEIKAVDDGQFIYVCVLICNIMEYCLYS